MRALIRRFLFLMVMVGLLVAAKRWFEAKPAASRSPGSGTRNHPDTSQQGQETLDSPKPPPDNVLSPPWPSPQTADHTAASSSRIDQTAAISDTPADPADHDGARPPASSSLVQESASESPLETSGLSASSDAEPADCGAEEAWEAELAFHVLREHGAFDATELGTESGSETAEPLTAPSPSGTPPPEHATVSQPSSDPERHAETAEDDPMQPRVDLATLPRQALYELAREQGLSPAQGILMSREELLEVLVPQPLGSQAVS
jgi:hypothetical protein